MRVNRKLFCTVSAFIDLESVPYSGEGGRMCSVKKVFLKISQNSKRNTCARVTFLIKLRFFNKG